MGNVSVSLPSDGSAATVAQYNTPITTIVTEFNGNIDNANIKPAAAIATSKLAADNGIGANYLSSTAITLGYAQMTANFSTASTTAVQVTGLTAAVTIPAGGRRIKITVFARDMFGGAAAVTPILSIWDGVVGSGTQLAASLMNVGSGTAVTTPAIAMAVVTPSAGAKTYNVGFQTNTNNAALEAGATFPAFILVEAI